MNAELKKRAVELIKHTLRNPEEIQKLYDWVPDALTALEAAEADNAQLREVLKDLNNLLEKTLAKRSGR